MRHRPVEQQNHYVLELRVENPNAVASNSPKYWLWHCHALVHGIAFIHFGKAIYSATGLEWIFKLLTHKKLELRPIAKN